MAGTGFMSVFNSLEKFNGTGDLKTWLTRFRRCCRVTNKNEDDVKGQLVLLCLEGQALAVAEQLETERDGAQTFAQVVERLENVFDTAAIREQTMQLFEKCTQKVTDTEDEFMLTLVQLYKGANPNAADAEINKAVKRKFMQGIAPELRRAIFVFVNDPYAIVVSYQRLLEYARTAKLNIVGNSSSTPESVCTANERV